MNTARPIFIRLIVAAVVLYVIGLTIMISDIYNKLGNIEHVLMHASAEHK